MPTTTINPFPPLLTLPFLLSLLPTPTSPSPLIDQLNQPPPPNFLTTITNNCLHHPSLPYCNSTPFPLSNIFKSAIVSSHLCNLSNNPSCPSSFSSIHLQSLPNLAPLYLSFSFFWTYCPSSIHSINLSHNSLTGPFPSQILHCSQIQSIDLSHNLLSGFLPLDSFSSLPNLSHLNLSYNRFTPDEKAVAFFKRFKDSSFIHYKDENFRMMTAAILLLVGVSGFSVLAVGCLAWRMGKRRRNVFSERVLRKATDGFSKERLVEKRGVVEIYLGRLRDGKEVEVNVQRGEMSREVRRRLVEEWRVLVKVRHRNVVKVLGWCDGREMRGVVVKRVEGDGLVDWLLINPPWKERMKVAVEVAEAMCFMEEEWPQVRCHLRADNVTITEDGEPLILKLKVHHHPYNSPRGNSYV